MTDPFKSQRFTSNLSPIRQESDRSANVSPSRSGHDLSDGINYNQTSVYYRSQSSAASGQPDLLNRDQQFRSAGNLGQYAFQLGQQPQRAPGPLPSDYNQINSNYINKELVKQLKSNVELLYKGTKILSHFALYPLKALRWQCQINSESFKYHLTPITLMPVFYNLNYHGYITLCKGCFSHAAFTGVMVILESVLGEVTSFEKNIDDVNSSKKFYGHLALKCLSSALTTPIFSAVIYESVQSGIVNETIGLTDLMRETWHRITGYKYNYRTRLIPFWSLILPTSFFMVGKHFLVVSLNKVIGQLIQISRSIFQENRKFYKMDESEKEIVEDPYLDALTELSSQVAATCLMYPAETVLYRLIVQGTRTIIDNTDTGLGVVPINTRYEGFMDCVQTISQTEGLLGFYKGIGAAVVETFICYALLRLAKTISTRIYDAEWTTRSDAANFKNYMSTNTNPPPLSYSSPIDLLNKN